MQGYSQLDDNGFTCQPLGFEETEQQRPVPPRRIEPFTENSSLYPVLHLVSLESDYFYAATDSRFFIFCCYIFVLANKTLFFCEKLLLFPIRGQISFFP